jgi:hypothetical protein
MILSILVRRRNDLDQRDEAMTAHVPDRQCAPRPMADVTSAPATRATRQLVPGRPATAAVPHWKRACADVGMNRPALLCRA